MGTETLVDSQIQDGRKLVYQLDQSRLNIEAAFWVYDSSKSSFWRLHIASSSPDLDVKKNTLSAYRKISEILQTIPDLSSLSISDIEIISLDNPFVTNLAPVINTGPKVYDIYFSNTLINNIFFEGLYIYRMNLPGTPSNKS